MHSKTSELPVTFEIPEGKIRSVEWGGMAIETCDIQERVDPGDLFKGLPDDRCQCPHWGVVLKGTLRYRYSDHEEVYEAGDVYYAAPGHLPLLEPGLVNVEFSQAAMLAKTMEVVGRNAAAMGH